MNDEYSKGQADRLSELLDQTQQRLEGMAARSKVRRAQIAELTERAKRLTAPVPSAAIQSPIPSTSPTRPAIAKVSLGDALAAFKAKRAAPPLYSAAQWAESQAKFDAIQAEIDALTQAERRIVYDAAGMHRVSAAPKPLEWIRSTGTFTRPLGNPEMEFASILSPDIAEPVPVVVKANTQPASESVTVETATEREDRRYREFVAMGGDYIEGRERWRATGPRGLLAALIRRVEAAGEPMRDGRNVREGLKAAATRAKNARAAGYPGSSAFPR